MRFTHLDKIPHIQSLFLGCARITNPTTLVRQDGEMGDVAANLVSVMHPEWRSREKKRDKRGDCDIAFPCSVDGVAFHLATKEEPGLFTRAGASAPRARR